MCLTKWTPTHPCCLTCDFSFCWYLKCVCWAPWLLFLFLSPLCKCLTKNINKTPWRVCQQDSYQGGDTCMERVKGERRANPGREARRCVKTSILKLSGNAYVERKVVYAPNRGLLLLFSRCWLYNRASCSAGRELQQTVAPLRQL